MTRSLACFCLLLAIAGNGAAGAAGDLVLALVDGEPITLRQLKVDFESRHRGHMSLMADEAVVRDFLEAAIQKRMFVQEGRRIGLADKPQIVAAVEEEQRRLGARWLYRVEVEERARVADEAVEAALEMTRAARHVVWVQTDTLDEAAAARKRIAHGADPMEVAREVSTDRSRLRGGVKRVTWGRYPAAIETAILSAADGDVTEPLELEEGWVFAVVLSTDARPGDVEERRPEVERVLGQRERDRLRDALLDGLRDKYGARIRDDLVTAATLTELLEVPERAGESPAVATFEGGSIRLDAFAEGISKESFLEHSPAQRTRKARQLLSDRLDRALVEREALRRWSAAPAEVTAELVSLQDDLVFRALLSEVVLQGLEIDDGELQAGYEAARDRYVEPARAHVAIALLDSEGEAIEFLDAAKAGRPFAELVRERSRDPASAANGGKVGWLSRKSVIEELRGPLFDPPEAALGGPVRIDRGWLVFTVLERRPERRKPLDEVRDEVRADLVEAESQVLIKRWETQLRAAVDVEIRDGAIRKAARLLEAEQAERKRERAVRPARPQGHGAGQ